MKKILLSTAIIASGAIGLAGQASADGHCGTVTIAEMNWNSAALMAQVDKIILSEGYGCEVEIVPGDTMPTATSMMEKGVPDIAPELWANAVARPLAVAVDEGRLHIASAAPITGLGEGWFVLPHTLKDHPELKSVLDVIERPDLFPHPEDPSKGALHTCPSGWNCQLTTNNLYRAFDMEAKGWLLVDPGSSAGLNGSISKAADSKQNWLGYYWAPTDMIGKYDMQMMDFGVPFAGADNWDGCIALPEQECEDPKPSAWTESVVNTVITDDFKKRAGDANDYLTKRVYPGPVMNGMLVYMTEEQANGEDAAYEFLSKHSDVWSSWVSSDVAAKVKAAL
ncbi:glycine betaine ABC transporter substrate-binding protein [Candidatus Puniceispirillum sp.]|uniref:glycine betaine ABC transporter substrate-binding protein n=1 Tax=Candidatus Puniceispirillum sp. TaxID=2026719 RepID=UPI003F69A133